MITNDLEQKFCARSVYVNVSDKSRPIFDRNMTNSGLTVPLEVGSVKPGEAVLVIECAYHIRNVCELRAVTARGEVGTMAWSRFNQQVWERVL